MEASDSGTTDHIHRIAQMMVSEMAKAEESFGKAGTTVNPYALMLLANLNLSKKYVELRDRLEQLNQALEKKTRTLADVKHRTPKAEPPSQNAPMQAPAKNPAMKTTLESDIINDLQKLNTLLSDPTAAPPAPGKAGAPVPFSETPQPGPFSEEENGSKSGEDRASGAQKATVSPAITDPSNLAETAEGTDTTDGARPLPETAPPSAESENPPAEKTAGPPPRTDKDIPLDKNLSLMETIKKETPVNHGNRAPMGSFPIHTASLQPAASSEHSSSRKKSIEGAFELPSLEFLKNIDSKTEVDHESIRRDAELLEKKLGYFGIKGEVMGVSPGPVITTFEYKPDPGIKISKIVNLADDLALALSAYSIRIVAPIPGKDVMGIEIPNLKKSIVPFIDIVSSEDFINSTSKLPICLGKDIIGNPVVVELESMPHLLIAGATGTGKSVGLNAMITSILYKSNPDEVKFLMIDPKRIELSLYNDIPHLITPVITDMKKATTALQWMVREMERRYDLLAEYQVRNIEQFNQKITKLESEPAQNHDHLPDLLSYIVIIIDELADLMMTASRDVELSLTRLAQMARAAGIHLILATQRPSVDVLTGIIKANFPTRISFQVSSKTDSRTIIDSNGAETLLGMGDMLFVPPGTARLTRVHGTYLSEEELIDITSFLKAQQSPEYLLDVITEQEEEPESEYREDEYDEKYQEALEVVMATRQASISGIQRALRVGYNRAARIIDIMEKKGIVGPSDGAKPRQVLMNPMD